MPGIWSRDKTAWKEGGAIKHWVPWWWHQHSLRLRRNSALERQCLGGAQERRHYLSWLLKVNWGGSEFVKKVTMFFKSHILLKSIHVIYIVCVHVEGCVNVQGLYSQSRERMAIKMWIVLSLNIGIVGKMSRSRIKIFLIWRVDKFLSVP